MRVRRDEGLAIHIGPEPCAGIREGAGEASAGGRIGQPLSHENAYLWDADAISNAEGNMGGYDNASTHLILRGLRPWHVRTLLVREPGDLQLDHSQQQRGGPHREGEEP